ncbi:MAG TPA: rhamnogalacturonan acetylesterase, partial [Opitutus sp.]|nr:rhamnogalacturonan acetylesterase [Opitutus sp.]
ARNLRRELRGERATYGERFELDESRVATSNLPLKIMRVCQLMLFWGAVFVLPLLSAAEEKSATAASNEAARPTLFIAGDSTAANGGPNAIGWGKWLGDYFDGEKVRVENRAMGGRSSRTFVTEGHWEKLRAELKAGDTVIIQFGHNDGGEMNGPRVARGSLPGLGEEFEAIENVITKQPEVVRTFGWYMRKMIADTRSQGAWPVLFTLTVRNYWNDHGVERGSGQYVEWIRQLAEAEKVPLVDHTQLIADRYERLGQVATNAFFPRDHVHTSEDGARLNALLAVSGLKGLREQALIRVLAPAGRFVPAATPDKVFVPVQPPPAGGGDRTAFTEWLNLPQIADPALPTVWLIGDSTVRNGRGNGYDGQFGWGDPFENYIYPARANVVNRAVGGTGARTFREHWERALPEIRKGDVVILQFGHNDNGARGALPGVGEETEERDNPRTEQKETVHTFGGYLRRYIAEARERGAEVVVCSLVPRNAWREGRMVRDESHAVWARRVAESEQIPFLDLNNLLADRYEELGEEKTLALFADKRVHTNWAGAELSAKIVAGALRKLPKNPVAEFMRPEPK